MSRDNTFESRGYPTRRFFQQRGLNTYAVEWEGDNLDPYVRDFVVLRFKHQEQMDSIEFFVTQDKSLIIYFPGLAHTAVVIPLGTWLVDQGNTGELGWVACDGERFHRLYEEK